MLWLKLEPFILNKAGKAILQRNIPDEIQIYASNRKVAEMLRKGNDNTIAQNVD